MSFWVLLQILIDLVLVSGGVVLWVRLHKPAKDDPRLSRGLQLLQSKIAVLEDLSDRTETQVSQLTAILETKCREIQEKIAAADRQISKIDTSAQKSLEVAKIFQDRIPHSEIVERQNTIKYVKAARMAHAGATAAEIAREVDLTQAEIEFIAKVNRDQLQFSEADLPEWAREATAPTNATHATTQAATPSSPVSYSLPRENFVAPPPANHAWNPGATSNNAYNGATYANDLSVSASAGTQANFGASHAPSNIAQNDAPTNRPVQHAGVVQMNPPPVMGGQSFMELDLRAEPEESAPAASAGMNPRAAAATQAQSPAKPAPSANNAQTAQTTSGKTVEIRPVNFPRIDTQRL